MFLSDKINLGTKRIYSVEGFLQVPACISRIGVQNYTALEMGLSDRDPKDVIRVFRPEEEVFAEESMLSFASKPVTDNHPPEAVTSKNSKKFTVGHSVPEVTHDNKFVNTTLHILDAATIAKIESGKVELSNGYSADIDWVSGISPEGEQFDAIQRNIKGNHIAIVDRGRAGPTCSLADNSTPTKDANVMKIIIDGVGYEMPDQSAEAVAKLQKRLSDTEEEMKKKDTEHKKEKDQAEEEKKKKDKELEQAKKDTEHAKSKLPTSDALSKMVADRAALIGKVNKIDKDITCDGKSDEDIMKEVVSSKLPDLKLDSVSDDYIRARFDTIVESAGSGGSQRELDDVFRDKAKGGNKTEIKDTRPDSVIARDEMMEKSRNAWKKGTK